jgi:transcription initiation factor TFIID subunit TAF12
MAQLGPEVLMGSLKVDGYLRAVATALGIDPDAVVKSPEEKQAEQQQAMAQQQAMMQQQQDMALQQQNNQAANQQKVEASKRG